MSRFPRCPRLLRRALEACVAGVALLLTVANTASEPYRVRESLVVERRGSLPMRLDARAYRDHPFQVELPAGTYSTASLYRLPSEPGGKRERVLQFNAGDERLTGDPVRIRLLLPSAEGEAPKLGTYLLVITDAEDEIHELSFQLVERALTPEQGS